MMDRAYALKRATIWTLPSNSSLLAFLTLWPIMVAEHEPMSPDLKSWRDLDPLPRVKVRASLVFGWERYFGHGDEHSACAEARYPTEAG